MKIKKFNLPSFEEVTARNWEDISISLGAYRCSIGIFCWSKKDITYAFAVALSNTNPTNIYTKKIFWKTFIYDHSIHTNEDLKKWYKDTIKKFNNFWEEHIISTYIEK